MKDVSVSKGVFAYNKFGKKKSKHCKNQPYKNEPWYQVFKETCTAIENAAAEVNTNTFRQILSNLENFVSKVKDLPLLVDGIPTGILLAGVNLPDHDILLDKLVLQLQPITPYIATVWSRKATTLKNLIEETVYQIINYSGLETGSDNSLEVKKAQCTFYTLDAWYQENDNGTPLVIIIPDFESFSSKILHDFILILSSYWKTIKFILIFGVATTVHIVHRSLSYDATSKLNIQVFHTETQVKNLSNVLDGIVLSPKIPFKLTGRAFKLLVDIFLWYDFSVNSFLQSYKICIWRHFYNKNEKMICCNAKDVKKRVSSLKEEDLKKLKKLPSIKSYLNKNSKVGISNNEFKEILIDLSKTFHIYIDNFLIILKCLHKISVNLPGIPFGRNFREIYATAVGNNNICETQEYKETIKMMSLLSKEETLSNIRTILKTLNEHEISLGDVEDNLKDHIDKIKDASLDVTMSVTEVEEIKEIKLNRLQWQEKLKSKSKQQQLSRFKEAQNEFIEYLNEHIFMKYLISPSQIPLNEIFCYNDVDTVNNYIRGSMKAVIYNGLNDPHSYLGCQCCKSDNDILPTHPDLQIIFKLHLEARKMINMYDWLQSFLAVIDPNKTDEQLDVDQLEHARFTRAVAELQFLGFIKATQKKTDHVKRLT